MSCNNTVTFLEGALQQRDSYPQEVLHHDDAFFFDASSTVYYS